MAKSKTAAPSRRRSAAQGGQSSATAPRRAGSAPSRARGSAAPSTASNAAGEATARDPEPLRPPQQDRGHRRVEQILDAAESVFADMGVDAATTHAIAERAGASMGSLYHFFPGKDAIVLAVARRFAERIRDRNASAMSLDDVHAPLPLLFDRIIGTHAGFIEESPAFAVVEEVLHRKFGACSVKGELDEAIIDQVHRFLEVRLPRMEAAQRLAATRLSVLAVGQTCERVRELPPDERPLVLRELRDMLVRYFEPLDREFGRA